MILCVSAISVEVHIKKNSISNTTKSNIHNSFSMGMQILEEHFFEQKL